MPTPEGKHRDGVNFVIMLMIQRINVIDGMTEIYDLAMQPLDQFTLSEPLDMAIVNDERVFHSVTPISPLNAAYPAYRDVLVITFRSKPSI